MANEMITDSNGKTSSKRVIGIVGLSVVLACTIAVVTKWIISEIAVDSQIVILLSALGTVFVGMITAGVLEKSGTTK